MEYLDKIYEHLLEWDLRSLHHEHPKTASAVKCLDQYSSEEEYLRVMEPLNLLEMYASVRREFEDFQEQKKSKQLPGLRFTVLDVSNGDGGFTELTLAAPRTKLDELEIFASSLVVISVPESGVPRCLGKIDEIEWNVKTRRTEVTIRTRRDCFWKDTEWTCHALSNMSNCESSCIAVDRLAIFERTSRK
ncbi:hypothetical protein CJU90_3570 [Yarrowia sp. C11]|nr:hypothetical protein CJU90_3570 [Yarrowia sp. C11]